LIRWLTKRKHEKVNRINPQENLVFVTCALLVIASFAPFGSFLNSQPENKWVAHPMYLSPFAGSSSPKGYNVSQIRTAYNLPSSGGAGTTIAIIDAYDTPNILNSFNTFSTQYGLPDNNTGNFLVHKMSRTIKTDSGWALETCLDVEWAHAIAPNATILLVEAIDNTDTSLLNAIDYATNKPGVVAVSMSWGEQEISGETSFDNHFNKAGITFFASSGDDGSTVMWPAASANVVSVGGTTLNLTSDGAVISEIAWSNSSGGISNYVARPVYQTNFGLTYPNRAVPDVSYYANTSPGVSVYNGTWWRVGGTSAGAPQWAAIDALGLSATNTNLYARAKTSYSSYFRDITSGSNNVTSAATGYDLVTGLGSPLTTGFGAEVTVSPSSGPSGGSVTINGVNFLGDSVNISYLNPLNFSWVSIISNLTTTAGNFVFTLNAPDLLQNNLAGDNPPAFNNIVFRAQDNSNSRIYNSTLPYTEWRRGLSQISNATAVGLFGNNTNLASTLLVQNGDSMVISGNWFNPGTASLFWDDTISLGTAVIDGSGSFNATVQVPTSTAGQHGLTVNDGSSSFCVNLTRLPTVANDYSDVWHTSDFPINLTPDYAINETFYQINGGPIFNVTSNGQPTITTESGSNTLEYWSTWNVYGAGITDLPHVTLTGIKLDKTVPTGSISSSTVVSTLTITLNLDSNDDVSGVAQMRFANQNSDWSTWEPYATSKIWTLQDGDGVKTVSVQYMDNAGLTSSTYNSSVTLQTLVASPGAIVAPSVTPAVTAAPTASPAPTNSPTAQPSAIPQTPELNFQMVLILLLAASTLMLPVLFKKKRK
jgi:hypothetical protein